MSVALPITWQIVGVFFFGIVVVALGFLMVGSFSRVETVSGVIEPAEGVARVVPAVSGTLDEILVEAGDRVSKGSSLAVVRTEVTLTEGIGKSEAQERILAQERLGLARQEGEIAAAARSRANEIDREIADRRAAIASLNRQIDSQAKLVETARDDLERAREIAQRGFVSKREIDQRLETFYAREQALLRLQRDLDQNRNTIAELSQRKSTVRSEAGAQLASLATLRSDIEQRDTESLLEEAYQLNSPVDGSVAVVAARRGDHVSVGEPVMLVLPEGSALIAELKVPSTAIGFLERGQTVQLAIDAFPSEHFGTIEGQVETIAAAPVVGRAPDGSEQDHYLVTVALKRDWVMADGERRALVAGMACSGTITTEKRTLAEWLFQPLFSVWDS